MQSYRRIAAGYESDDDIDDLLVAEPNQKIKVVNDKITQNAGLNNANFNTALEEPVQCWFHSFQETYNRYKRNPLTEQQLKATLLDNENPMQLALKFFALSPGCNNLKNKSLALFILELICDLATKNPNLTEKCDDNTRMVAFNFVKLCGMNSIYKAVIRAYGLKSIRPHLLPQLQELLQQGYYKDVAYWAIFLDMTEHFGIFDLLFPLMLQDKISLAEEYMDIAQNLQLPVVQFLDSLIDKKKNVHDLCDEILAKHKYQNIRHGLLLYKPMCKLVTRLAKKYKLNEKNTPNLVFSKSCGYLRFLFYKYHEGGMNLEAFRELVPDVANHSKDIQLELLRTLSNNGELDESVYWLKRFQFPIEEFPDELQLIMEYMANKNERTKEFQNEIDALNAKTNVMNLNADSENEFLKLTIKPSEITLVDNCQSFDEMLNFMKHQQFVAFDSEWKPSLSSDNSISLLQLATAERVYLVDCMSANLTAEQWRTFGREIFNNLEILKIGFGIEHDLRLLQKSLPLQMSLQGHRPCFLDLRQLWRRLKFMDIISLPFGSTAESGEGLSALTKACFGKKLDKSNQCSNWANRPLRPDQLIYAALDAHCLVQIYQLFGQYLQRVGLEIDKVVEEITTGKTGYLFRMKTTVMPSGDGVPSSSSNTSENKKSTSTATKAVQSVVDIGFVCDSDLKDLAKELRKLGIHCILIKSEDFAYYVSELERERRFLLTRQPQRHNIILKQIGRDKCLKVVPANAAAQAVFVLQHFKIQINERHFYTRCLECNGNEFILAYKEEIIKMRQTDESTEQGKKFSEENSNVRLGQQDRNFLLLNTNQHILKTKTTYRGKPIRLQQIKDHHFKRADQFLICDSCGFVVWYGAQPIHGRIAEAIGCDPMSFPIV